jgi:hypothetical protein
MVNSESVRASNAKGDRIQGFIGVFVGGTGGIGEATLKEVFRRTTRPKVYMVGRQVWVCFAKTEVMLMRRVQV